MLEALLNRLNSKDDTDREIAIYEAEPVSV